MQTGLVATIKLGCWQIAHALNEWWQHWAAMKAGACRCRIQMKQPNLVCIIFMWPVSDLGTVTLAVKAIGDTVYYVRTCDSKVGPLTKSQASLVSCLGP